MRKPNFIILFCCLLASGCASLSSNSVDTSRQASLLASCNIPLKQQIDALAQPLIDQQRTPGLVVALLTADQQRHIYHYGFTDRDRRTPVTGDTLFAIGSVTKGFTAESAALLVQDGKLNWDDTLGKLLGDRLQLSHDAQQITLLQLATHTSGLPRQMTTLHMFGNLTRYLFNGAPFYDDLDDGEFVNYLHDYVKPPQQSVVYSNLGYAILDYVISQHTQQTPQQIASQQIIAPLRLTRTGYQPEKLPGYLQRAHGHAGDQPKFMRRGEQVPDWHFSGYMVGAASLWSSASDLLSYLEAHLYGSGDARLDRAFADATRVRFQQPDHDSSALAWLSNRISGQTIFYQSGFIGGYSSYIGMDVRHKTAIVVLQNSFNWDNDIGHRMLVRIAEGQECAP
ncbi:beta-lactamase family protein [Erwiniaceae bacterium BAC15a-03b]|uniref:Beta-lactamase family protein n=1 Tax=Winslowiella arboricola TaxID=2978220 RepID=A0A9J6Q0S7_9GAMM|nr:serine hydrolase domain-containing protein [Winslowiella arboricola]MCU5772266.1 beta-lactamase family protein [Winslowiella arboricola]MCU5779855.1 beta-lactamase family protein [Winslowiella arboricola]